MRRASLPLRLCVASAILTIAGCSGASAAPIGSSDPGTAQSTNGTLPPPTSTSTTPPPPTSTAPPPPPKDTRLFPAEIGRTWTGTDQESSLFGNINTATLTVKVTGKAAVDGRNAWIVESTSNGSTSVAYVDLQGDDELVRAATATDWLPELKSPVAEGTSWTYQDNGGSRAATWHSAATMTVAAGTFGDCWRIDYVVTGGPEATKPGDVMYATFCRGVGLVKADTTLSSGYIHRYELTAMSF